MIPSFSRQCGVSLVEILVAMAVGLTLLAGAVHLFLGINRSYLLQDELSRIQENTRYVSALLARDIRMARFTGCPSDTSLASAVTSDESSREWMVHFDLGITGIPYDDRSVIDGSAISEGIVLHRIDPDIYTTVVNHDISKSQLYLADNTLISSGDMYVAISPDCRQTAFFKASQSTTESKLFHESASGGTLYNCTDRLGGDYNCTVDANGAKEISLTGYTLYPVFSVAYYLRNSNGVPNLYRKLSGETASGMARFAEALIEGIDDMRFLYGVDTDSDGVANQYRKATEIGLFNDDWRRVTSVRIELLFRGTQAVVDEVQTYFFNGTRQTSSDGYLRKSMVMTVESRNRMADRGE